MAENFVTLSLETHLFFSRIMKEHALFLKAGFPCKNHDWIQKAENFRKAFEQLLIDVVNISNNRINAAILNSNELVTEFTIPAEKRTSCLSGIPINTELSQKQKELQSGNCNKMSRELFHAVHRINERALQLLNEFIQFKECILKEVHNGNLFTANYPLLIEHILREAKLYRSSIHCLMNNRQVSYKDLWGSESFWNRIMMEHALFIRGLLDPCEEELIQTADNFAMDYKALLETAKKQDCKTTPELTETSLEETLKYRDFKSAGADGILNCKIATIILPLLADHVLREANHYIRILEQSNRKES